MQQTRIQEKCIQETMQEPVVECCAPTRSSGMENRLKQLVMRTSIAVRKASPKEVETVPPWVSCNTTHTTTYIRT